MDHSLRRGEGLPRGRTREAPGQLARYTATQTDQLARQERHEVLVRVWSSSREALAHEQGSGTRSGQVGAGDLQAYRDEGGCERSRWDAMGTAIDGFMDGRR